MADNKDDHSLPQNQENIFEQLKKTLSPETQKYLDDLITKELEDATQLACGETRMDLRERDRKY